MTTHFDPRRRKRERGQSTVEFALVAVMLVMLIIGVVEICRMVLVYTTVANGARAGVRYAIVHGSDSPVLASDVQGVVQNFLGAASMNTTMPSPLTVNVTYGDATKKAGSTVTVAVTYAYDPITTYFPLSVSLGSTSQGVITF